ncbi:hypothetical protein EWM64_g2910 [Hericium alpestre]|uniref:Sld7 C-terminal domain-containing protein n=1 Tax=Hericium alpestre TaxID=135208 RepID=A0A4Z0A5A3_9AGAM|nr:hypothetical protein EWM64_g2910 [Hericium alpestre]
MATSIIEETARSLDRQTTYVYTPPSHRLLYRGSLAVPASKILLEGITFTVPLTSAGVAKNNLLDNPIALALEMYLDKSGDVSVDINPLATLTTLFFNTHLCATPLPPSSPTTQVGIRITLGDPGDDHSSDILIYGTLQPPTNSPSKRDADVDIPTLHLKVARILHAPFLEAATPATAEGSTPRLPRPDDPSPRLPPLISFGRKRMLSTDEDDAPSKRQRSNSKPGGRALSRSQSVASIGDDDETMKHARDVMLNMPKAGPSSQFDGGPRKLARTLSVKQEDAVFKVPPLPAKIKKRGDTPSAKGKGKEREVSDLSKELEKANKSVIKQAAVEALATIGISKTHAEWKELWGFMYHGTVFAMRAQMQTRAVDGYSVNRLVKAHMKLSYLATFRSPLTSSN